MKSLEQLDSWITSKLRTWSGKIAGGPHPPELLEIRRDILNEIRDRIEWHDEGKQVFPFNAITIQLAGESAERRALLEGVLGNSREWEGTIASLLKEAGCRVPAGLRVTVSAVEEPASGERAIRRPFHIEFATRKPEQESQTAPPVRPSVKLTVVRGETDCSEYQLDSERINLGRLKEVTSDRDGLRRRNHVAFAETETTVSREHAYIQYDIAAGRFRLYDCSSQRGTRVFRDGRRFDVPNGPARGFQLRPGDEIHLGDARVRFETGLSDQP